MSFTPTVLFISWIYKTEIWCVFSFFE